MRKALPTVTLIAYDNTDEPERTLKVMKHCQKHFAFIDSALVCRVVPDHANGSVRLIKTRAEGYQAGQNFEACEMIDHVASDHALFVSHDGFIINPDMWRDEWLDLDFIGAPWPPYVCMDNHRYRVGNTGFCLRSRAFMEISATYRNYFNEGDVSDVWACRSMRRRFEGQGMRYATVEQAAAFSWEIDIPEYPDGRPDAFGFHNLNLHPEFTIGEMALA